MLQIQKVFYPALLASLLIAHGTAIDSRAADPAAAPETPTVPWTQEKVTPPEVKDKDKKKEVPVATCEKKDKHGDKYHQVVYADGTKVRYWPENNDWVIEIPGPNGPTKITYQQSTKGKWVKEPGQPNNVKKNPATDPGAKEWKQDLEKAEEKAKDPKKNSDLTPRLAPPVRQASLRTPSFHNWLFNVGYYQSAASLPSLIRTDVTDTAAPIQLAATVEKEKPTPKTEAKDKPPAKQAYVVINLKVVTYGGPTPGVTIHFDPEDPKRPTPDEFVKKEDPQNTWKPDDVPGPRTTPGPKPGGFIPVDPKEKGGGGGYVNIGGGWAYVRIPVSFLEICASDDDDADDGPNDGPTKQSPAPKADPKKQSLAPGGPQWPRRETAEAAEYHAYKLVGQQRGKYDLER